MTAKTFLKNLGAGTIENKIMPTSCVQAAGFNAAHTTTSIATAGYKATAFILTVANDGATPDWVMQLYESDVSVTDAGTAVVDGDMIVHGISQDGTAFVDTKISAGVLTMTNSTDEHYTYVFVYTGRAQWVRLQCISGTKTNTMALTVLKFRKRAPLVWG